MQRHQSDALGWRSARGLRILTAVYCSPRASQHTGESDGLGAIVRAGGRDKPREHRRTSTAECARKARREARISIRGCRSRQPSIARTNVGKRVDIHRSGKRNRHDPREAQKKHRPRSYARCKRFTNGSKRIGQQSQTETVAGRSILGLTSPCSPPPIGRCQRAACHAVLRGRSNRVYEHTSRMRAEQSQKRSRAIQYQASWVRQGRQHSFGKQLIGHKNVLVA